MVPCSNVDWDYHKVILLEKFELRSPAFDIIMREYTIQCQLGVPVCACKVTSRQLRIGWWGWWFLSEPPVYLAGPPSHHPLDVPVIELGAYLQSRKVLSSYVHVVC